MTGPASAAASSAAAAKPSIASAAAKPSPSAGAAINLKVIDTGNSSQVPIYVALDRGYFKEQNLDVELVRETNVSTAVQMVATNQVGFQASNPDPVVFNALDRGIDLRLLASSSVNRPVDKAAVFMVRQDLVDSGKYKEPNDLKDLNVAQVGVYSLFFIDKVLSKGGLTLDDVKLTQLPAPDIMTAFSNKGMDAGWVTEPYASNIVKQGWGKVLYSTGELAPGQVAAELIMSPRLGKDQPDAIKRFVTAFVHGARDYYHAINKGAADKGPIIDALVNHTAVKDKALYATIGLPSINPNADVDPTPSWNEVQDFYIRRGIQKTKIDLSKYIDSSFVNAALAALGRESV